MNLHVSFSTNSGDANFQHASGELTYTSQHESNEKPSNVTQINLFVSETENRLTEPKIRKSMLRSTNILLTHSVNPNESGELVNRFSENIKNQDKRGDRLMSNLVLAISESNSVKALNEISEIIKSKEGVQVLSRNLKKGGNYHFLIHLAFSREMFSLLDILNFYEQSELIEDKPNYVSSRRVANSGKVTESIKPIGLDSISENRFFNLIKKISKKNKFNEQKIKDLVYVYPFFTQDNKLINCLYELETKNRPFVITFLNTFIGEGFPSGIENLISAEKELQQLNNKFQIPTIFNINILKNMSSKQNKMRALPEFKWEKKDWSFHSAREIAKAITLRDACLIQSINFNNVRQWLQNKGDLQSPMITLEETFQKTVNWITYEIVRELIKADRRNLIQKFIEIGAILLDNKNFHGALQVSLGLSHASINRLLSESQLNNKDFQELIKLGSFHSKKIELHKDQIGNNELFLPITDLFWEKLGSTYSEVMEHEELKFKKKSWVDLANRASALINFRTICPSQLLWDDANKLVQFFCNLDNAPDDVINAYSSLCRNRESTLNVDLSDNLKKWRASHFVKFLENENDKDYKIDSLFKKEIFNGELFIDKFSKNNTIIKGWSKERQEKILELYLKSKMGVNI